jgi:hypothetical protein
VVAAANFLDVVPLFPAPSDTERLSGVSRSKRDAYAQANIII